MTVYLYFDYCVCYRLTGNRLVKNNGWPLIEEIAFRCKGLMLKSKLGLDFMNKDVDYGLMGPLILVADLWLNFVWS